MGAERPHEFGTFFALDTAARATVWQSAEPAIARTEPGPSAGSDVLLSGGRPPHRTP